MQDNNHEELTRFFFELGQLKRTPRTGWFKLGIENPESVAEHPFRTAAIGFALARLEGVDPYKTGFLCLFHDIAEARTGDLDRLAQRYLNKNPHLTREIIREQIEALTNIFDGSFLDDLQTILDYDRGIISRIARDADILELLIQSLEYIASGHSLAKEWFYGSSAELRTDSGQKIGAILTNIIEEDKIENFMLWWKY